MSKVLRSFAKAFQNQADDSDDDGSAPPSKSGSFINPRRAWSFGRKKPAHADSYEVPIVPKDPAASLGDEAALPIQKRKAGKKSSLVNDALNAVLSRRRSAAVCSPTDEIRKPTVGSSSSSTHPPTAGSSGSSTHQGEALVDDSRPNSPGSPHPELGELGEAERVRFVSQVSRVKAEALQACEATLASSCSPEDIHAYRDNILGEAWRVICTGYLTKEYTRYVDAENRHKRFLKENREVQTAYLRELTALRDQLRTLPEGAGRFLAVSHFEVLQCLDPDLRPLVEAAVQERMRVFLGQSHAQDSELSKVVSNHLAEERAQYVSERDAAVAIAEKLRKQVAALESDSAKTESVLDRERQDALEVKESLAECESERDALKLELNQFVAELQQLKALHEHEQRAHKAKEQEIQDLEAQLKASLASRASTSKSGDSKSASRSTTPGLPAASSSRTPLAFVASGQVLGLPEAAAETLEIMSGLQGQLGTEPQTAVELHRVLEALGERLDSDCLEAAYKCKPRATAASIELLAHRVRTGRKECAITRQCCITMVEAILATSQLEGEMDLGRLKEAAENVLEIHKNLLLQGSSVSSQNLSFLEEPRLRAIQAAAVVLGDAAPAPPVSRNKVDNGNTCRSKTPPARGKTDSSGLPCIKGAGDERSGDAEAMRPMTQQSARTPSSMQADADQLCPSPPVSRRASAGSSRPVLVSKRSLTQPLPSKEEESAADSGQHIALPSPVVSKSNLRKANITGPASPPTTPAASRRQEQASAPGGGAFVIPRRRTSAT